MTMRDKHSVDAAERTGRHRHGATQVHDAVAEDRIGEQTHAVQIDQDRRVTDVPQPGGHRRSLREAPGKVGAMSAQTTYGEQVAWEPARPRFHPLRLIVSWLLAAASLFIAAWIVPGVSVEGFAGAVVVAVLIAVLNAVLPPVIAALRLPLMALLGFLLVLILDALMLLAASEIAKNAISVDDFWAALLAALVTAAVGVILDVVFGTNDDDTYTLKVVQRIAKRQGGATRTEDRKSVV